MTTVLQVLTKVHGLNQKWRYSTSSLIKVQTGALRRCVHQSCVHVAKLSVCVWRVLGRTGGTVGRAGVR